MEHKRMKNITESNVQVYCTTDYSVFKHLEGNRMIMDKRVGAIMDSIEKIGQKKVPILVNADMEVIDGQGRLEAFQRMGLPVYFIVDPKAGIEDCIAMNVNMQNWKLDDYILSYATTNNPNKEDYKKLIDVLGDFSNDFPISLIVSVAGGVTTDGIRSGDFKFVRTAEETREILSYLKQFVPVFKTCSLYYWAVYNITYKFDIVDKDELLRKVQMYQAEIIPVHNQRTAMDILEEVFNKKKSKKVSIKTEYLNKNGMARAFYHRDYRAMKKGAKSAHLSGALGI